MTKDSDTEGYQVLVVNIKYGRELSTKVKNRPDITILDLPEGIVKHKDESRFFDDVETFAYNTVTRKYGAEVNSCQVFLPNLLHSKD